MDDEQGGAAGHGGRGAGRGGRCQGVGAEGMPPICSCLSLLLCADISTQDKIESIAIECMTPPTGCLAGIAYKTITDMLMLFPARFTNFPAAAALAYTPSGVLLTCLKEVFDQAPASDEVLETLLPLARHIYHDPTRANRRSAAAILSYLVHPSEDVQAAVKAVMRKLKEEETRFFEIQMLALRGVYMDEVLPHILARRAAEESGEVRHHADLLFVHDDGLWG